MKNCKIKPNNKNIYSVNITKVNPIQKFDEGSIPELDYDIKNKKNDNNTTNTNITFTFNPSACVFKPTTTTTTTTTTNDNNYQSNDHYKQ
jgi:hypothetical protein